MPLDPQAQAIIDQFNAAGTPPLETLPVKEARELLQAMAAMQGDPPAIARIDNRTVPGAAGEIPVRIYTPRLRSSPLPALVYFHGGGWVLGNLESHEGVCRTLANSADCIVISVDYRLAPENKFPAAAEDAFAATKWVAENAWEIGADRVRLAIGGDSAGGNLTAVVALMARDRGGPPLRYQLLVYPVTDSACDTPSYRDNADGYLLTRDAMLWFWNHYTRGDNDRRNPYAAPLQAADLRRLPPALVITAEFDPLRDEGEAYAARLREAGVPVVLTRYHGMIHGFFGMGAVIDQARQAMAQAANELRAAFSW